MKAVIPAAGLGRRFLPVTKNSPKEMLPLVDTPAIQYVVEECVASGIRDILIITGRGKRAVEDHFDRSIELEATLEAAGDVESLKRVRRIAEMANIHFVRQKEPLGLGHAVGCAESFVGNEPFALLLGDDIIMGGRPATAQLMSVHRRRKATVLAVERVPKADIASYGVIQLGRRVGTRTYRVQDLVEKPRPADAPSDLGIMGRYVLTPDIFAEIRRTKPGKKGEIQLTDAIRRVARRSPVFAHEVQGRRYDLGEKFRWLVANIEVGLQRPEFALPLRSYLLRRAAELQSAPPAALIRK